MLVNQKHVGHVAMLALVLGWSSLAQWLGIEHPLLLPFAGPGWRYSPISGFDPSVGPFLWFKLYWAAWTLLLALVAGLFWVRGVETGIGERVRIARRRFRGRIVGAVAAALGLVFLVGGFVFYNTLVLDLPPRVLGTRTVRVEEVVKSCAGWWRTSIVTSFQCAVRTA